MVDDRDESHEPDESNSETEITVAVSVDGIDLDEQQQRVVDTYEDNIETFIRKNKDYGGSFENSAKIESIMRHGEVREDELFDIIAEQILVRGFYDKLSRFHQLQIQGGDDLAGEKVEDTLLDMGNYAIMLAAMQRKYSTAQQIFQWDNDDWNESDWRKHDIQEFMDEYTNDEYEPRPSGKQE